MAFLRWHLSEINRTIVAYVNNHFETRKFFLEAWDSLSLWRKRRRRDLVASSSGLLKYSAKVNFDIFFIPATLETLEESLSTILSRQETIQVDFRKLRFFCSIPNTKTFLSLRISGANLHSDTDHCLCNHGTAFCYFISTNCQTNYHQNKTWSRGATTPRMLADMSTINRKSFTKIHWALICNWAFL